MDKLPKHAAFLQDIHGFLKSLEEERLPELIPQRVLYEIYLEKNGVKHDRCHYAHYMAEYVFGQCIAQILKEEDPSVLPYDYTSKCPSGTKNGHSRFIGLSALCGKYRIRNWTDDSGSPGAYYAGIRWSRKKAGHAYGKEPKKAQT